MRFRIPSISAFPRRVALDIPLKRASLISAGIVLVFCALCHFPFFFSLLATTSHQFEFGLRHRLKRDPQIDPRVVIYALGDSSLADLHHENLEIADWVAILNTLDAAHPRAIIIDKVFSAPVGLEESRDLLPQIKALKTPIMVGAFVAHTSIGSRPLQTLRDIKDFFPANGQTADETGALDWWTLDAGYAYGPTPEIQSVIAGVGHVMYGNNLTLKPMLRLGRSAVLPALPLLPAHEIHFHDGKLFAEGNTIPIDSTGRVLVNLSAPGAYYDRTHKLSALLERARENKPLSLPPDAVVVILPALYTGNTDLQPSPFGILPGGYFITAILNSALTGNWIKMLGPRWLFILMGGLLGLLVILVTTGPTSAVAALLISIATVGAGLSSFIFLGVEVPWLLSCFATLATALLLNLENSRIARLRLVARGEAEKDFSQVMDHVPGHDGHPAAQGVVRVGRYHMLEVIGQGGMGEVYRAKAYGAGGFEKEFAIKRIGASHLSKETRIRMFEEEARLTSQLSHANIAQVFEFFRMNETYLMVLEYIRGKNLAQLMSRSQDVGLGISEVLAVQIIDEILKGLEYAHEKCDIVSGQSLHITHRDISPQNIMLSYEGAVKIIDFGIAKNKLHTENTAEGTIKGKFAYMSPEQAKGGQVDSRSDIFSTGLILYELLTGMRVMEGSTDVETIDNVRKCRIPAALAIRPDLPETLDRFLGRCLAKDPQNRFVDASAAHAELQVFLQRFPYHSLPHGLSTLLKSVFPHEQNLVVQPEASIQTTVHGTEEIPPSRQVG